MNCIQAEVLLKEESNAILKSDYSEAFKQTEIRLCLENECPRGTKLVSWTMVHVRQMLCKHLLLPEESQ